MAQRTDLQTGTRVRDSDPNPGEETWTMVVVDGTLRWLDDETYGALYKPGDDGIVLLTTADYEHGPKIDGAEIVRNPESTNFYLVAAGTRYLAKNPNALNHVGFEWSGAREVTDEEIDPVPEGPAFG
jgi:hypothetical protein